nr:MAG TPA: hypothetical protein [Caudoviricetes sp.]
MEAGQRPRGRTVKSAPLGESTGGNGRSLDIRTHVRILDGS